MHKDVPSLFEKVLRRCQAFAADNNPVWIKCYLVLMGELALAIKRPELVSSGSPTFKRYGKNSRLELTTKIFRDLVEPLHPAVHSLGVGQRSAWTHQRLPPSRFIPSMPSTINAT